MKGRDATDFQEKLLLLEDQWNKVLRRSNQRTASVDRALAFWDRYIQDKKELESRLEQLNKQLQEVGSLDRIPLQKLHQAMANIQVGTEDSSRVIHLYHQCQ